MDEFAQTRGVDELFDDEIVPIIPQEVAYAQPESYGNIQESNDPPLSEEAVQGAQYQNQREPISDHRIRGSGSSRGHAEKSRGRGRSSGRGGGRGKDAGSSGQPNGRERSRPAEGQGKPGASTTLATAREQTQSEAKKNGPASGNEDEASSTEATSATRKPNEPETPRVFAVRGDRSGTGGVKKVILPIVGSSCVAERG
jgi:hypothetical protein